MRIGRRRLTLFGLRPKHTSILITITTGILIVAASLTVLSIASEDVRTALFRMQELQEALQTTRAQYEGVVEELARPRRSWSRRKPSGTRLPGNSRAPRSGWPASRPNTKGRSALEEAQENAGSLRGSGWAICSRSGRSCSGALRRCRARIADLEAEIQVKEAQIRAANLQLDHGAWGRDGLSAGDIVLAAVIEGGVGAGTGWRSSCWTCWSGPTWSPCSAAHALPGAPPPPRHWQLLDGVFERAVRIWPAPSSGWVVRVVSIYNTTVGEPLHVDLALVEEQRRSTGRAKSSPRCTIGRTAAAWSGTSCSGCCSWCPTPPSPAAC